MRRTTQAVSAAELCLHLAGGTARDYVQLRQAIGRRLRWTGRPRKDLSEAGLTPQRLQRILDGGDRALAAREVERLDAVGARLVSWRHDDYPACLRHLSRPPLLLAVRGRWPVDARAVAVVGARAATSYGQQAARRLAGAAARAGMPVISGLARGIDRHALEAAIAEQGWPVAVLGCGLDVYYPPEHRDLQETIAERGTLISEFPMGQQPDRFAFPRRNRIIAALAQKVLVVEAAERSGALITADHALEIGREVLAVPGPIDSVASRGTNRLIADGAHPVLDENWMLELAGDGIRNRPAAATDDADEPLLVELGTRALSPDVLAARSGQDVRSIRSALIALELAGRVRRVEGGRYARRDTGPRARRPRAVPRRSAR
ncbi:MAG: DNA-processing protein DprA [Planctomycetota bacterium]|jgi:DNA processing protein